MSGRKEHLSGKAPLRVIFFGTSNFGSPSLEVLHSTFVVLKVFTGSPKLSGRGMMLQKTPIQIQAENLGIQVHNSDKPTLSDLENEFDVGVVVSYGHIISSAILSKAKYGFLNVHPSDLPKFRGAAPIERTIQSGDESTRVCIIKMTPRLDDGDIILSERYFILEDETATDLHAKFAKIGAELLLIAIQRLVSGNSNFEKQDNSKSTYAHKISKEELFLDPIHTKNMKTKDLINKIRAFTTYGSCFTLHDGKRIKVAKASFSPQKLTKLDLECIDGFASPVIIKQEGKNFIPVPNYFII